MLTLYRLTNADEWKSYQITGKLRLSDETWFTTSLDYINRVAGKKKRIAGGLIILNIPDDFFTGKLAVKKCKTMPDCYRRLPSFHSGQKDKIQVKLEKNCLNFGVFNQSQLDALMKFYEHD